MIFINERLDTILSNQFNTTLITHSAQLSHLTVGQLEYLVYIISGLDGREAGLEARPILSRYYLLNDECNDDSCKVVYMSDDVYKTRLVAYLTDLMFPTLERNVGSSSTSTICCNIS